MAEKHGSGGAARGALVYAAAAGLGLAAFFAIFGPRILDPQAFGWLFRSDWGQHFIGWLAYLRGDWGWPLGRIEGLEAPQGTSLVYVDALPAVAIPLKAALGAEAEAVQFQGWWFLACTVLQAVAGLWALRMAGLARGPAVAGAALLLLWPAMYQRIGHDTLVAHWTLLLAMGAVFVARPGPRYAALTGLLLLTLAIHAYLTAMVGLLLVGRIAADWQRGAAAAEGSALARLGAPLQALPRAALAAGAAAVAGLGAWMWALGYFVVGGGDVGAIGLGHFSMNLAAPVNPFFEGYSTLLETVPTRRGQYEGFLYFGAGALAAVALAALAAVFVTARMAADRLAAFRALALAGLAGAAIAVSPVVALGPAVLVEVPLPGVVEAALAPFRSSGRFGWLPGLALLLWAVAAIAARLPRAWATAVLAGLVALQIADLRELPRVIRAETAADPAAQAEAERLAELWPEEIGRVSFLGGGRALHELLYPFGFAAVEAGAETDLFYLARFDAEARAARRADLAERLAEGRLAADTLYVAPLSGRDACRLAAQPGAGILEAPRAVVVHGGWLSPRPSPIAGRGVARAPEVPLARLVEDCGPGCAMALAVADDAAARLPDALRRALAARGAEEIARLGYRESYLVVLEAGRVLAEARSGTQAVAWSGQAGGLPLSVRSAGHGKGPGAGLTVGGVDCSAGRRGFNGLLWRQGGGEILRFAYDTHASPGARPLAD